jgi:hypothetical protein
MQSALRQHAAPSGDAGPVISSEREVALMPTNASGVRRLFFAGAFAILLTGSACESASSSPGVTPSGAAGAAAGTSGAAGAAAGAGGPVTDPATPDFRAGLQSNGSITYVRNK